MTRWSTPIHTIAAIAALPFLSTRPRFVSVLPTTVTNRTRGLCLVLAPVVKTYPICRNMFPSAAALGEPLLDFIPPLLGVGAGSRICADTAQVVLCFAAT